MDDELIHAAKTLAAAAAMLIGHSSTFPEYVLVNEDDLDALTEALGAFLTARDKTQ